MVLIHSDKSKPATKTLSIKATQSVEYELYKLSESLSLCAFVAGLDSIIDS